MSASPPLPRVARSLSGAEDLAARLREWLAGSRRLLVLTGAGASTDSGIPDYRGPNGSYSKGHKPMTHQEFVGSDANRRRYWARSAVGWPGFVRAAPNRTHSALARLEARGRVELLVTQNVDGLHQQAGSRRVVDLHGRLDATVCLACGERAARGALQRRLLAANADWLARHARDAAAGRRADGDVELAGDADFARFAVPACARCGGVLMPDVVFFGGAVPKVRVAESFDALARADAVLVVGSSLEVYSGYRFVAKAAELGLPIAIVNRGGTRAERAGLGRVLKLEGPSSEILTGAVVSAGS